jgi:iron complex outermembrane recepter protein
MFRHRRMQFTGSASAIALAALCQVALAQSPPGDSGSQNLDDIVVTGTRIVSRGFSQPTPTTVLGAEDISKAAEPNIFTTITELPSLQGSTGTTVSTNSTSSGVQGLSSFGLRGLGTIRTLTLIDNQRVVGANVTGVADVSLFPQLLIQRVDVVTGGASASYGSDAIGGVVNFVTEKHFEGFKANVEGGLTTYGDDANETIQAAWGSNSLLGGRLHVELSGEFAHEAGIPPFGFGIGPGPDGRTWFNSPAFQVRPISQTTDGLPQMIYITNAQDLQYAKYGLITKGPLQGIAFGANGAPYNFRYGSNGVPTGTGSVTNCYTPFCVGGDLSGNIGNGTSLASELFRRVAFTRIGYDLNDRNELYITFNASQVDTSNEPNPGAAKNANLTIQCSNPFVPSSIQAACATNNITSFQYGTSNAELPQYITVRPDRTQYRFVLGEDGEANLFGTNWNYHSYYEHGTEITDLIVQNMTLTPRYNAAINAVAGPNGTIVCASAIAQAEGCVPLNVIGNVAANPAALAWIAPANGPFQHTRQTQDVLSTNISGEPFTLWAGPLAVATGFEYRREWYRVDADPYGNGISSESVTSPSYPADPLLNTSSGNNWYAGNYHDASGSYDVREGYLELNLPLWNSQSWGQSNLNVADRETDYSTSGKVNTWKIGGVWKTPLDGFRLRGVVSRDVRAPNLSELYAAPQVVNASVNNDHGSTVTILQETLGNTALQPERAETREVGIALVQPSWLRGFSASIDYYNIKVDGEIATLSAQQEVDLCNAGNQTLCQAMLLNSPISNTNYVKLQAFNLASVKDEGFDIETSYRLDLSKISLPGDLTIRALATHTISFLTNSGVIGTIPQQTAGVNLGVTPYWKLYAVQSWDFDKLSLSLTERWFSDGVYSHAYIQCTTGCPVATVQHPTINVNSMPGATYLDLGGSYRITDHVTASFKIDNLLNEAPAPAPGTGTGIDLNSSLYDAIGRMFRASIRVQF